MCCSASCTKTVSLVSLYVHWLTQFLMTLFFCQQWHGPEALRYNTVFQCYISIQTIHRYTVPLYKRPEEHNSPPNTKSTNKWIWAKLLNNESDNWILFSSKVIWAVWKFLTRNQTIEFCFHQKLYWLFENFCGRCGGNKCFEMDIDCFVLDQNLISLREKASCPWSLSYDDKPQINSFFFALTVLKVTRSDDIYC